MLSRASTDEAAHELIEIAKARGGPDNITVQIVAVGGRRCPSAESFGRLGWILAGAAATAGALLWLVG